MIELSSETIAVVVVLVLFVIASVYLMIKTNGYINHKNDN